MSSLTRLKCDSVRSLFLGVKPTDHNPRATELSPSAVDEKIKKIIEQLFNFREETDDETYIFQGIRKTVFYKQKYVRILVTIKNIFESLKLPHLSKGRKSLKQFPFSSLEALDKI